MRKIAVLTILLLLSYFIDSNGQTVQLKGEVNFPATTSAGCISSTLCCFPSTGADTIGIQNVKIKIQNLDNSAIANDTTDSNGLFDINVSSGNLKITPSINSSNWTNGVSTFDLVILNKHINQTELLKCPFRRIACDVENDGDLDTFDTNVIRQLILSVLTSFPNVPNWRFVPKAYVTQRETHPYPTFTNDFWNDKYADSLGKQYPFNATLLYNNIAYTYTGTSKWMDTLNQWILNPLNPCNPDYWGFYAFKSGDANGTANYSSFSPLISSPEESTFLNLSGQSTSIPVTYKIPAIEKSGLADKKFLFRVKASSPTPIEGYQLGIYVDPAFIELQKVTADDRSLKQQVNRDFSRLSDATERGYIKTLWVNNFKENPQGINITRPVELFSLEIKAKQNTELAEIRRYFELRDNVLRNEFYGLGKILSDVQITIEIEEIN